MTSQFDFTNNEWADIASLPELVGYAMAMAEDSGRVGTFRELRTLAHDLNAKAPDNDAKAIIEAISTIDVKDKLDEFEPHAPDVLADVSVKACREITKVLADRAQPSESIAYRRWVLHIAYDVAETAKEQGARVSGPEAALLERLTEALSL